MLIHAINSHLLWIRNYRGRHPAHGRKSGGYEECPEPKKLSQLRDFLDLLNYYHRFLLNVATAFRTPSPALKESMKVGVVSTTTNCVRQRQRAAVHWSSGTLRPRKSTSLCNGCLLLWSGCSAFMQDKKWNWVTHRICFQKLKGSTPPERKKDDKP